jgi:molybdopterin molybdotransferase
MIEYPDARARVLAAAKGLPAGSVPLPQSLGRTLARDIKAAENIPPFTKATMDGYAVRAADTRRSGSAGAVELDVLEDLPAGRLSRKTVGPGQAVRIMTGAPLPAGADAVVMVEDTGKAGRRVTVRATTSVWPEKTSGRARSPSSGAPSSARPRSACWPQPAVTACR